MVAFCSLTIEGDMDQKVKIEHWQKVYIYQFLNMKIVPHSNPKILSWNYTHRDLPYTKLMEILWGFWWTFQIWHSGLVWRENSDFTETTLSHIPWWITEKWTWLNLIISPNQSTHLKFSKFSKILIKYPLIWYMVGLSRPHIGRKFCI